MLTCELWITSVSQRGENSDNGSAPWQWRAPLQPGPHPTALIMSRFHTPVWLTEQNVLGRNRPAGRDIATWIYTIVPIPFPPSFKYVTNREINLDMI
jgi:hypothetical protein